MASLSAAQICTEARTVAKCPGFSAQSGRALNLTLDDLLLKRNVKINRYSGSIAVTSGTNGPFNLPADYLRTYDLFYTVDNQPYFLTPVEMGYYDAIFKDPSVATYPYLYATDLQPQAATPDTGIPLLYIYPASTSALTLTHRYFLRRPNISTPETSASVPWFPDQDYLIHATAMRLMKLTDDARYEKFKDDGESMLRDHLLMEGDEQGVVHEVKLDPLRFRSRGGLKPTKTQPF